MDIASLAWWELLIAVVVYWVVLVGGWMFYVSRPTTRARAWERAIKDEYTDAETGKMILRVESTESLLPAILALVVPPVALLVWWLLAGS